MLTIKKLETDKSRILLELIMQHAEGKCPCIPPKLEDIDLWQILANENNYGLIGKLCDIEKGVPGFSSIVVPPAGFSKNPETHEKVIAWLKQKNVNILDVNKTLLELTAALHNPLSSEEEI